MEPITLLLVQVFGHTLLKVLLGFFAVNTILGVVKALFVLHDFRLGSVADWLGQAVPLVVGALAIQSAVYFAKGTLWDEQMALVSTGVWSFAVLAMAGKLLSTLRDFGFSSIPESLTTKPSIRATPAP